MVLRAIVNTHNRFSRNCFAASIFSGFLRSRSVLHHGKKQLVLFEKADKPQFVLHPQKVGS
jgi:hypothetical protein